MYLLRRMNVSERSTGVFDGQYLNITRWSCGHRRESLPMLANQHARAQETREGGRAAVGYI